MPKFIPGKDDYFIPNDESGRKLLLKKKYDEFNTSLLGLGDISRKSLPIDAVAAVFDLEGFTNFSKQIEPHLSVPLFLSKFLSWLLSSIKDEMTEEILDSGVKLYGPLPFLVKFLGDGILVLWNVSQTGNIGKRNIVLSAHEVCSGYISDFLPNINDKVVDPPPRLRCGVAMGTVFSVGDGNDFVGSCINMAARLQKIPGLTFAFNRRGFNLDDDDQNEFFKDEIIIKKISIRGIGDNELIAVLNDEFKKMPPEERKLFRDV